MHRKKKIYFTIIIVAHVVLVLLALSGKLSFLFNDASLRKGQAADFFAVFQAGDNFLQGQSLYADTEGISIPYSYPFRYLPFIGYSIGSILSTLSPFFAYGIWIFFYEVLIGYNIYLTGKLIKDTNIFAVAVIPWLLFSPYLIEIFMGQWSFLLASLFFYTLYGIIKDNAFQYLFVLAPLMKPNALIISPILLKLKKFKLLFLTAGGIILTSCIYFSFFREDIAVFLENFNDVLYSHGGNFGFKSLYYIFAVRIFDIPIPRAWFFGFIVLSGLFTLYITFIRTKDPVLQFVIWICYFFFIYKDIWEHHYVLFMPVFVLLVYKFKLTFEKVLTRKYLPITIAFLLIALPSLFGLEYLFLENAPTEPDHVSNIFAILYHFLKIAGVGIVFLYVVKSVMSVKIPNRQDQFG